MLNHGPSIRAVTFDVDGTLYSLKRMMLRHGLTLWPVMDVFRDMFMVRQQMRGQGPFGNFRLEQANRLAAHRGISTEEAVRLVEDTVDRRWMRIFDRVRLYRGLRPALQQLKRRGILLGLISDYPILPKLAGFRLPREWFEVAIDCEQVGALKPHPAPFEAALSALRLPAAQVLHVGDQEDADVTGALGMGMQAALFCRRKSPPATRAQLLFSDWSRFVELLEQRNQLNP